MVKALRILGAFLLSVIVLVIGLVVLVFVVLAIPPLRAIAVRQGVNYANTVMGGYTIQVKAIDRLDPWGLNARGIQLFDEQKREMVSVQWVMVRLNPLSAISKTLRITNAEIDGVAVHLYPSEAGPPEPEDAPTSSEPSTFTYRADQLRVRGATLDMELAGRNLHAVVGTLRAGGQYGPKPAIALQEARIRVEEGKDVLLRLATTEGDWDADRGGKVGIAARIGSASLTAKADVQPIAQFSPWPIRTASLQLEHLTRRDLERLGVPDGAELNVPIGLTVDAKSDGAKLNATARLRAGQGGLSLKAQADDKAYDLTVDIRPSRLSEIASILPDLTVEGSLRAHASPTNGTPKKVELRWRKVALDHAAVPDGIVRAELPLPVVRLNGLTLAGMEEALVVRGEYDTDRGRGQAHLVLKDFQLQAIEYLAQLGLAGDLNGDLAASFSPTTLKADGKLALRAFRHPSAQLQTLDLTLQADGPLTSPQGDFTLNVSQLVAGEVKIDKLDAEARATLDKMNGRLQVRGPSTMLKAEVGGMRTEDGDLRVQAIGRGYLHKRDLRFDIRELLYGEGGVSAQEVSLYSGKQSVRIRGRLDKNDRVDATLQLARIDLAEWAKLGGMTDVGGKVDGTVTVDGTVAAPRVDSTLKFTGARYKSDLPLNATLAMTGDLGARKAELKLEAYSSEELGAKMTASVAIPKRPDDLGQAMQYAKAKLQIAAWMPIEQISAMVGDQLAGLGGMLEVNVSAEGTLDDPKVDADVTAAMKLPGQEGEPVEAIRLVTVVSKEQAKVDVWTKDEAGELLKVAGFVDWPGGNPRAALDNPAGFRNARFQIKADLQSRRFDDMQGVFAYFSKLYALALPIRAAGSLSFEGNQGQLEGSARMALVVYGDKLDGRCRIGAESAVDLDAKLKQDTFELDVKARTDGGGLVEGKVRSHLALNTLTGEDPTIGPAKVTLTGKHIALYKMPGLCNLAGGEADFTVSAAALGKQKPTLDLQASITDLHAPEMDPLALELQASAGTADAKLAVQLKGGQRDIGLIEARVPLTHPDGVTPTVLPNAQVNGRVRFHELPLATMLSFTQALGRTSGTANADITVTGKINDPYPAGFLELADVNLSIAALAQPLRNIDGRIDIKGRSVNIKKLSVHDRDGKITMEGFASLKQDFSGEAGVYLEADEFPLRQQGQIIGELTTRARLDVKIPENLKADAKLKILDGRMWLTGERGKSVQSLDPHPDIRFADEKVEYESTPTEETAEGQGFALGSFKIQTERELWLMHKDFGIQVGVELAIKQGEDGPTLEGEATLDRGELQLLGKPFKLQRGSVIRFAGPLPPDPELEIKAAYKPPSGQDLIVQVTGRGSAPVLEFSGAASNAGEALLVLQKRGPSTQSKAGAESEAASSMAGIAADMTAGLLIMTARREFGDWVPMISVDTGASGQPTSARAGFDASKLIPPWAEGFAKSAYIEGIVGQGAGGGRVGVGVKLEVGLPRDFITILGYGPNPGGWSTDVAWAP